jgi:hypothetical protein
MKKITLLLVTIFFTLSSQAQIEIVELADTLLQNTIEDSSVILSNVNVFKDPRLTALKNRPQLMAREDARERIIEKRIEKLGVNNVTNYDPIKRGKKTVTGSIVSRKGYRVVIYSGSNRAEALNAKRDFMRSYGGTRSYMSYNAPYFKIRVGDFESKTTAYKFLRKIQGKFPKSFVAPDIVTIKNINVR